MAAFVESAGYGMWRMMRAGFPAMTQSDGNDFVTTDPAPTTTLSPKVTPGRIVAPPPIHTLSPMVMGSAHSMSRFLSSASRGWQAVYRLTLGPMKEIGRVV